VAFLFAHGDGQQPHPSTWLSLLLFDRIRFYKTSQIRPEIAYCLRAAAVSCIYTYLLKMQLLANVSDFAKHGIVQLNTYYLRSIVCKNVNMCHVQLQVDDKCGQVPWWDQLSTALKA